MHMYQDGDLSRLQLSRICASTFPKLVDLPKLVDKLRFLCHSVALVERIAEPFPTMIGTVSS